MDAHPSAPEAPDYTEAGRKLFAGTAEFYWAAPDLKSLPPIRGLEIAFAGRSNVGKSSLINALTGRNALARTSHTPGRTQLLNFFAVNPQLSIVDMPGYGYAAVGKGKVAAWTDLIHAYLRGRTSLARVFLLIDARHGLKDTDKPVLDTLERSAVTYQIVLTKIDELKKGAAELRVEETLGLIQRRAAAYPEIIATSSQKGLGVEALRAEIAKILAERGGR